MPKGPGGSVGRRPKKMTHREKITAANEARNAAVMTLTTKYSEEYRTLLKKERVKRGLPAISGDSRRVPIDDKIERAEARLQELIAEKEAREAAEEQE